ncbi:MAG TPA: hypothetical protein VF575_02980 [Candidatus Saccharimonadales bacterium]|jgi:hypothetical protein
MNRSYAQQPPRKRAWWEGWWEAFKLFLKSPDSGPFIKLMVVPARVFVTSVAAYLPVNVANDVLFPFAGMADDVVMPINFLSAVWLVYKVNKYRKVP